MINAKKTFFMLTACTVLAVTISASTFSAPRVMIAQEATGKEPLQIAQTETSGVSLAVEQVAAAATEIGREEVTATVSPSNALYNLEWSLTVGDSLIPEADMSDYLTIEEKSATTIELVCHQRFDGYAKLHVEDAYTGKTASADVSAWAFSSDSTSYAHNGDFKENTTGEQLWTFHNFGENYNPETGKCSIIDEWGLYIDPDEVSSINTIFMATFNNENQFCLAFYPNGGAPGKAYLVQDFPTLFFVPGREFYLVFEVDDKYAGGANTQPYLYGEGEYYTVVGQWQDGNTNIIRFSINESAPLPTYQKPNLFGIGFEVPSSIATITVPSVDLYLIE